MALCIRPIIGYALAIFRKTVIYQTVPPSTSRPARATHIKFHYFYKIASSHGACFPIVLTDITLRQAWAFYVGRPIGQTKWRRTVYNDLMDRIATEIRKALILTSMRRPTIDDGSITIDFLIDLFLLQENCCALCGKDISRRRHLDHIVPVARGGIHTASNVQFTCPHCNLSKSNRILDEIPYHEQRWWRSDHFDPHEDQHRAPSRDFKRPPPRPPVQ